MKITKHGRTHDDGKAISLSCSECKCEFEVLRKELSFQHDQRDGNYYYFRCPECSGLVTIAQHLVEGGPAPATGQWGDH